MALAWHGMMLWALPRPSRNGHGRGRTRHLGRQAGQEHGMGWRHIARQAASMPCHDWTCMNSHDHGQAWHAKCSTWHGMPIAFVGWHGMAWHDKQTPVGWHGKKTPVGWHGKQTPVGWHGMANKLKHQGKPAGWHAHLPALPLLVRVAKALRRDARHATRCQRCIAMGPCNNGSESAPFTSSEQWQHALPTPQVASGTGLLCCITGMHTEGTPHDHSRRSGHSAPGAPCPAR